MPSPVWQQLHGSAVTHEVSLTGTSQCSLVQSIKQHSYVGCEMGPCVIVHSCQASWMTLNVNVIFVCLEKKKQFLFLFHKKCDRHKKC